MILYTPIAFDKNEWFIIISMFIMFILIMLIPKLLNFVQVLSLWLFNIFLAHAVDYSVIGKPINLYYSNDSNNYEIFDFLLYYFLYPSSLYLFFIGFAYWHFLRKHWFIYVCCATIITTALEYFAHLMGVFTYINWSIWYSLFVYIPLYSLHVGLYHFVKYQIKQFNNSKNTNLLLTKK